MKVLEGKMIEKIIIEDCKGVDYIKFSTPSLQVIDEELFKTFYQAFRLEEKQ